MGWLASRLARFPSDDLVGRLAGGLARLPAPPYNVGWESSAANSEFFCSQRDRLYYADGVEWLPASALQNMRTVSPGRVTVASRGE